MNRLIQCSALLTSLLLSSVRAVASPEVDVMSDVEVSEYAIRMSSVMEKIDNRKLCLSNDIRCVRAEFSRHGISYDDKEQVKKRLHIMMGSMH